MKTVRIEIFILTVIIFIFGGFAYKKFVFQPKIEALLASANELTLSAEIKSYIDNKSQSGAVGSCAEVPKLLERVLTLEGKMLEIYKTKQTALDLAKEMEQMQAKKTQLKTQEDRLSFVRNLELTKLKGEIMPLCLAAGKERNRGTAPGAQRGGGQ